MDVEIPENEVTRSAVEGARGRVCLESLFAAMEAALPAPVTENQMLADANVLVQLLVDFAQGAAAGDGDTGKIDFGEPFDHYLQVQHITLSSELRVRLVFWQTFIEELLQAAPFDQHVFAELKRLRPALLILAMRDQNLILNAQAAPRQFLDVVLQEGATWYPQSGKEGSVFLEALTQVSGSIQAAVINTDNNQLNSSIAAFTTLIEKQIERANMMEKRYCENELGMAKIYGAQKKVMVLLDALNGCLLPETVLGFIPNVLRGELQFILINQGEMAGAWQSWVAIIKRLPQVFPAAMANEGSVEPEPPNRQQLYRDVQIIVGLLDEHVTVSAAQQQNYDDGVEDLRERLFEKLRGIEVTLSAFTPLSVPDELSRAGAAVSPSLLKKVAGLKVGDWFLFNNSDHQVVRCKLLLRPPEIEQLIFVNRSGHRVLQKSVQDFSACLATRIAAPLDKENCFDSAIEFTTKKMRVFIDKQQALKEREGKERNQKEQNRKSIESKKEEAGNANVATAPGIIGNETVTADLQVSLGCPGSDPSLQEAGKNGSPMVDIVAFGDPSIDRKSAAQKALQEARVLAKLEIRHSRQQEQNEVSAQLTATTVDVNEQVLGLNPGAWLDLPHGDGETFLRCKLVAIMRSSDTFIFADRRGAKIAEYDRATLISLLANQRAKIISNGDDFEGQLSKVVLTLRRDT